MVNRELLNKILVDKVAYAPPTPSPDAATGGAPMDPSMMGTAMPPPPAPGGGGGTMGMDPAAMGMDPAAMMGGAPMDPSMMGGVMPPPPMDPSMVGGMPGPGGGAPPMDPSMGGGQSGPPIMLSAEDLQMLIEQAAGVGASEEAPPEEPKKEATKDDRLDTMETMLGQIMDALQISPAEGVGALAPEEAADASTAMASGGMPESMITPTPDEITSPSMDPALDMNAIAPIGDLSGGAEMPKMAAQEGYLSAVLSKMNNLR